METEHLCSQCGAHLLYTQAVPKAPDHLYCPDCRDVMYDPETGDVIGKLI